MSVHVFVGAGAVARTAAVLLADAGHEVRMVSRRGTGPAHDRIEAVAADATDTARLTELVKGAEVVYNSAAAPYHLWPQQLPPLFGSILTAAEASGADYVMVGNLYGYGPADGPVTPQTPLAATGAKGAVRARMWEEAKAAHDAGRLRVTEVRSGQFLGMGAYSIFDGFVAPRIAAGHLALVPQHPDTPHPYTFIGDAARALVAVAGGEAAWGRAWHSPTITASLREVATRYAALTGSPEPRLEQMTERDMALLGHTAPFWDELPENAHMDTSPYPVDDAETAEVFGLRATGLDEALTAKAV